MEKYRARFFSLMIPLMTLEVLEFGHKCPKRFDKLIITGFWGIKPAVEDQDAELREEWKNL